MPIAKDQTAVITGAGSGIGRALALELSRQSIQVVAVGRTAETLRRTVELADNPIRSIVADIRSGEDREKIVAAVESDNVNHLVHLAGFMQIAPLVELTAKDWEAAFQTIVHARLYLTQDLLPKLSEGSRILFVGSQSASVARAGAGGYCTPYAASSMLARCLQLELGPRGVAVNQAIPGAVNTDLLQQSMASDLTIFPDAAAYKRIGDEGRWVRVEAVARFFSWLLAQADHHQFNQPDINIADESHHSHWAAGLPIYHGLAS